MLEFTIQSKLNAAPDKLWDNLSMDAVNQELWPLVKMTVPEAWRHRPIARWETGRLLLKSWILLFGFIPVDRHSFYLAEIQSGIKFRERSYSWMNREWNHTRTIAKTGPGCIVTDHIEVAGRIPLLTRFLFPVYKHIFRHRHRRLLQKFANPDCV
jgi:ligand-binding SRPBCC domain-containing protein